MLVAPETGPVQPYNKSSITVPPATINATAVTQLAAPLGTPVAAVPFGGAQRLSAERSCALRTCYGALSASALSAPALCAPAMGRSAPQR